MKGKIFNTQEVQAIIAGNKTMFREVIKPYPILSDDKSYWEFNGVIWAGENSSYAKKFGDNARPVMPDLCPYQVGQKIFCKETFAEIEFGGGMGYNSGKQMIYKVDDDYDVKWKPAQHMKQEHSRLTLEITDIKVERLQDISNVDCRSQGEDQWSFICNWNSTHKKPEEKFEANPFVWVVNFKINK